MTIIFVFNSANGIKGHNQFVNIDKIWRVVSLNDCDANNNNTATPSLAMTNKCPSLSTVQMESRDTNVSPTYTRQRELFP